MSITAGQNIKNGGSFLTKEKDLDSAKGKPSFGLLEINKGKNLPTKPSAISTPPKHKGGITRLSEGKIKKILAVSRYAKSMKEVARITNIGAATVRKYLKIHGVNLFKKDYVDYEKVDSLLQYGKLSFDAIGVQSDCSASTISTRAKLIGVSCKGRVKANNAKKMREIDLNISCGAYCKACGLPRAYGSHENCSKVTQERFKDVNES